MRRFVRALLLGGLATGCAFPSQRISPHGRTATVHTDRYRLNGELIAVTEDTVWLLARPDSLLVPVGRERILRLDVQRHQMSTVRTLKYMAIAGATTGVLLMIACSNVDDAGCEAVIPVTMAPFVALGALFGLVNFESAWMRHQPGAIVNANPYSRFPQGLPDTVRSKRRTTP